MASVAASIYDFAPRLPQDERGILDRRQHQGFHGCDGLYRRDGEARTGLIEEIAHSIDFHRLIFEAPKRHQQVWLIEHFGSGVNLGNIRPDDVLPLETLRLGLRADTLHFFHSTE